MKRKTLGRYHLDLAKSQSGVMGEVLFGHDPEMDRQVAIKRVDNVDAARREARALAACGPNEFIPAVYDFFVVGHRGHIVMERIVGKRLGGDADGEPRPKKTAVAITMNIVRALRHVHSRGYLHMDIKPPNVLIPSGTTTGVRLLDFGGAAPKNFRGRYKGTPQAGYPPYMPPEQFDDPAILDDTADLYQAAGVCVFLLTGRMPIDAPNVENDKKYNAACRELQMNGLTRVIADAKLNTVLAKALDPKPSNRYRKAQDLIEALRPFGE